MVDNSAWEICERVAEVQALLHDHVECGKHTAAVAVAKAQAVLSEPELLRAMFDAGYSRRTRRARVNKRLRLCAKRPGLTGMTRQWCASGKVCRCAGGSPNSCGFGIDNPR
jgi:hypothetical protein